MENETSSPQEEPSFDVDKILQRWGFRQGQRFNSPVEIQVMLHYYSMCEPHPHIHAGSYENALKMLVINGLLVKSENSGSGYESTHRGNAWVNFLCSTPFPVQIWIDPRTTTQEASK